MLLISFGYHADCTAAWSQCEREGIQLLQDQKDDEETWEDLLEDEEIVWDPTCKLTPTHLHAKALC